MLGMSKSARRGTQIDFGTHHADRSRRLIRDIMDLRLIANYWLIQDHKVGWLRNVERRESSPVFNLTILPLCRRATLSHNPDISATNTLAAPIPAAAMASFLPAFQGVSAAPNIRNAAHRRLNAAHPSNLSFTTLPSSRQPDRCCNLVIIRQYGPPRILVPKGGEEVEQDCVKTAPRYPPPGCAGVFA